MNERMTITVLGGFGVFVGLCAGIICARRGRNMSAALFYSGLIAPAIPLAYGFVSIMAETSRNGAGVIAAFLSASFFTVIFMLTVPLITGIPALISAAASFWMTDRFCRSKNNPASNP